MYDEVLHLYVPTTDIVNEAKPLMQQDLLFSIEDPPLSASSSLPPLSASSSLPPLSASSTSSTSYIYKQNSMIYDVDHNDPNRRYHGDDHDNNNSHPLNPHHIILPNTLYKQNSTMSEYSAASNDDAVDEDDTFNINDNINNNRITFNSNISYHDDIHARDYNNYDNSYNYNNINSNVNIINNNNILSHHDININTINSNKEVFVFGFGAVVFWGFHRNEAKELLDYLQTFVVKGMTSSSYDILSS